MHRGHHEANADLVDRALGHIRADHHVHAHLGQRVRGARFRRQVTVAMFGNGHAGARDNECGRGRDVQGAQRVAAGADDVHRALGRVHCVALGAHDGGSGGIFCHAFPARPHGGQQRAHLGRCRAAFKQLFKRVFGLTARQRAFGGRKNQRFHRVAHAATFVFFRKFSSIAWPCSDRMLSGWNCTPSISSSLWRRPMIRPLSSSAVISRQSGRVARSTTSE